MASPGTLHDAFIDELRDVYNAEQQITKALPKMIKAATSPDLKQAFTAHLEETKEQVARVASCRHARREGPPVRVRRRRRHPRDGQAAMATTSTSYDGRGADRVGARVGIRDGGVRHPGRLGERWPTDSAELLQTARRYNAPTRS